MTRCDHQSRVKSGTDSDYCGDCGTELGNGCHGTTARTKLVRVNIRRVEEGKQPDASDHQTDEDHLWPDPDLIV